MLSHRQKRNRSHCFRTSKQTRALSFGEKSCAATSKHQRRNCWEKAERAGPRTPPPCRRRPPPVLPLPPHTRERFSPSHPPVDVSVRVRPPNSKPSLPVLPCLGGNAPFHLYNPAGQPLPREPATEGSSRLPSHTDQPNPSFRLRVRVGQPAEMEAEKKKPVVSDVGAWAMNVVSSVGIIMANKQLMSAAGYAFSFGTVPASSSLPSSRFPP
jgi:hypothetical protein